MKAYTWQGNGMLCLIILPITFAAHAASCQVSASILSFGSFSPLSLNFVDSTGSITVNCTDVNHYSIALSAGNGSYTQRTMVFGSHVLEYNLYRDAALQQVWGDGSSSSSDTVNVVDPVDGQHYTYTVYGRIVLFSKRGTAVGTYTDTIGVIVNY